MTGEQRHVQALAISGEFDHYGVFGAPALAYAHRIEAHLATAWSAAGAADRAFTEAASGCLAKLSSVLLQAKRIRDHHEHLIALGIQNSAELWKKQDATLFLQGAEACTDFENLLLQGRAALDRLTFFLSFQLAPKQRDPSDRFSRLRSQLESAATENPRASELLAYLQDVPDLWGFFSGIEKRSLRAYVAHRLSSVEWLDSCFGVTSVENGRCVIFDAVVNGHPIFRTSFGVVRDVTYFLLNCVAVFTTREKLSLEEANPAWSNRTVVFSEWHSPEKTDLWRIIAKRMKPGGFEASHAYLRPSLRDHAIVCPEVP